MVPACLIHGFSSVRCFILIASGNKYKIKLLYHEHMKWDGWERPSATSQRWARNSSQMGWAACWNKGEKVNDRTILFSPNEFMKFQVKYHERLWNTRAASRPGGGGPHHWESEEEHAGLQWHWLPGIQRESGGNGTETEWPDQETVTGNWDLGKAALKVSSLPVVWNHVSISKFCVRVWEHLCWPLTSLSKRFRVCANPGSVFDYDPAEDNIQSPKLTHD